MLLSIFGISRAKYRLPAYPRRIHPAGMECCLHQRMGLAGQAILSSTPVTVKRATHLISIAIQHNEPPYFSYVQQQDYYFGVLIVARATAAIPFVCVARSIAALAWSRPSIIRSLGMPLRALGHARLRRLPANARSLARSIVPTLVLSLLLFQVPGIVRTSLLGVVPTAEPG